MSQTEKTVTSRAYVYYAPGEVRAETRSITAGPTDILVSVQVCGRCGTDAGIFRKGHFKVDANAPVILGHELCATVVWVGPQVRDLREGQGYRQGETLDPSYLGFREGERVTVQARIARHRSGLMLIEDPVTILSFYIDGGYSQYMKIPETLIRCGAALRVPAQVSDEAAALVEPAACALESIYSTPHPVGVDADGRHLYRAGVQAGGDTAIIGSGTVSLIYARLAKLEGARTVYVLVRSQEKAELVRRLLGDEAAPVNIAGLSEEQIVERMAELTGGRLLDDVVAACGDPAAQRLMLELYTPEGYAVGACFGGVRERIDRANLDLHHYRMAKTIGSSGCSTRTMEALLRRLTQGRLSLDGFASSRRWTLDDAPAEFFTARDGGLKPMLRPWG